MVLDAPWPHTGTEAKEEMGRIRTQPHEMPSELREKKHGTMTIAIH